MRSQRTSRNANRSQARAAERTLPAPQPARAFRAALTADLLAAITALLAVALLTAISLFIALPAGATTTELEADGYAYGFVSRVEGEALLLGVEVDDAIEAEINHPLLTGDQINTGSGRIELVLPDGTIIRAAPGTVVVFDALAGAPDSEAEEGTFVSLDQGELQVRTPESFFEAEDVAIQTANATIYLGASGSYRIIAQGSSFTEVVVREGFAEADTRSGSKIARSGEALEISGNERPFVNRVEAGPADSLELWAGDLDMLASEAIQRDVDPRLSYAAAPLEGNGEWLDLPEGRAWRPYVRADWRPFRYGRWVYTPSGLTWVASAPWGWVTSHYGFWDFVPGYGWLWLPGNVYSPAGVYWYWGPTHVAWVPYGYYNRYSRGRVGYGIYGWAGGDWSYWNDWTFCPTRYFGRRGYDNYWNRGQDLERGRRFAVPRGIVTTDTRGLGPESWGKPSEALERLVRRVDSQGQGRSLPDVTDFVARRKGADVVRGTNGSSLRDHKTASRERLAPLAGDSSRDRFRDRSVAVGGNGGTSTSVRSVGGNRGVGGGNDSRTGSGGRLGESAYRSDGGNLSGSSRGVIRRVEPGTRGGKEPPSSRVRSVGDRRLPSGNDGGSSSRSVRDLRSPERERGSAIGGSGSDRSGTSSSPPARRVVDRIRAHREAARGSSSGSSAAPQDSGNRSSSVSKGSSSSSSKSPPRSSGSSASRSRSSGESAKKASPPPRGSKSGSSGRGFESLAVSGPELACLSHQTSTAFRYEVGEKGRLARLEARASRRLARTTHQGSNRGVPAYENPGESSRLESADALRLHRTGPLRLLLRRGGGFPDHGALERAVGADGVSDPASHPPGDLPPSDVPRRHQRPGRDSSALGSARPRGLALAKAGPALSCAPRLMAIRALEGRSSEGLAAWTANLARAGIDSLQLRDRSATDRLVYEGARSMVEALAQWRAPHPSSEAGPLSAKRPYVLVNRRPDISVAAGASGVHLPARGLPTRAVREAFGAGLVIGRSTHSLDEVAEAQRQGADFVVFGPVFSTPEKLRYGAPLGLEQLARAASFGIPVLAIGGITQENLEAVARTGAAGAAAIRLFEDTSRATAIAGHAKALFDRIGAPAHA